MPSTIEDRFGQGQSTAAALKLPCKVVITDASYTLSGEVTYGGTPLVENDRVLRAPSSAHVDAGIWIVSSGAWSRSKDWDGARDVVKGTMVLVAPNTSAEEFWIVQTDNPIYPGTTAVLLEQHTPEELALRADLADTSSATKGAGIGGLNPTLAYAGATIGGRLGSIYYVRDAPWEADAGGVASARTDVAAADVAATAAGKALGFGAGTYLIDSNLTITSQCYFEVGAVIRVATGVTLLFTQPSSERWALPKKIFDCVGTGKVQWLDCSPTVYPEWWTTNAVQGTTNMTTALQRMLDCVVNGADSYSPSKTSGGAGRARCRLTTKRYRTTAALDGGQRDQVQIVADGLAEIVSDSTTCIIDFSSTKFVKLEGIHFTSYTAAVGLQFNRITSNPYTIYVKVDNCAILVGTNPSMNGGQGSIGVANCRAEQNVWDNCDVRADVPLFATQTTSALFPPVSGTQDTTIVSLVVGTFRVCNFLRHTKHNAAVILMQPNRFRFDNCYWATVSGASGANPYAISADTISGCTFSGVLEGTERYMSVAKTSYWVDIDLTPQVSALDGGGIINFDSADATGFVNSKVRMAIQAAVPSGKVIRWSGSGPSLQLFNVTVETGDPSLIEAFSIVSTNASTRSLVARSNALVPQSVASAAALSLPIGDDIYFVTGTTNITSINTLGLGGKKFTLIFSGVLTLTDGNNIKAEGNFVTSANSSWTGFCDGTTVYEISRSLNG